MDYLRRDRRSSRGRRASIESDTSTDSSTVTTISESKSESIAPVPKKHKRLVTRTASVASDGISDTTKISVPSIASNAFVPASSLFFHVNETPSWYLCIIYTLQHCIVAMVMATAAFHILMGLLCLDATQPESQRLLSSILLITGETTFLQNLLGVRLPVVSGPSLFYLYVTYSALLMNKNHCYDKEHYMKSSEEVRDQTYQSRRDAIRGPLVIIAVVQMLLGLTGLGVLIVKKISPITLSACIFTLGITMATSNVVLDMAAEGAGLTMASTFTLLLFAQLLRTLVVPMTGSGRSGLITTRLPIFSCFSLTLTVVLLWGLCAVLKWNWPTDAWKGLTNAPWYIMPVQKFWSKPVFGGGETAIMMSGLVVGIMNSVYDHCVMSEFLGLAHPPHHALNRGFLVEGIATLQSALTGSSMGFTTMQENVSLVDCTKVGSRLIMYLTSLLLIGLAIFGKTAGFLLAIPRPIIAGIILNWLGIVATTGISISSQVNMSSPRNVIIIGLTTSMGLLIPLWVQDMMAQNGAVRNVAHYMNLTGNPDVDIFLTAILSNGILVSLILGTVLDMAAPGDRNDRGVTKWHLMLHEVDVAILEKPKRREAKMKRRSPGITAYDLPLLTWISFWMRSGVYIPILPAYVSTTLWKALAVTLWPLNWCPERKRRRRSSDSSSEYSFFARIRRWTDSRAILEDTLRI